MIYFLHGNDFAKIRSKLQEIISSQQKKNPEASYFKVDADSWSDERLEEFTVSRGLFQNKFIIVLDGLFSDKKIVEEIKSFLPEMQGSENIFILVEGILTKEIIAKIEKKSEKTQVFATAVLKEKKSSFDVFVLTDAFGARDKKRMWFLYQKAILLGVLPEEIHRLLFWQTKAMIAAQNSPSASNAGLNPFVYKKSLGFSKNFSKKELLTFSEELVCVYHDARRGTVDFGVALERFVLEV